LLDFEYQAIEEAAKNHPATLALTVATEHTPPPAIIALVSQLNHDAQALGVITEKLSKRGFTTIPIEVGGYFCPGNSHHIKDSQPHLSVTFSHR
jgi:hypothetical protein